MNVKFAPKPKRNSARCSSCGDMLPANTLENGVCRTCGSIAYNEKGKSAVMKASPAN